MGWDDAEPILLKMRDEDRERGYEWTEEDWRREYQHLQDRVEL